MQNEEVPNKYFISKGTSFKVNDEIQLECYEYIIKKDEDGYGYYAVCKELHAVTQGDNWEELKDNILEVHSLMLDYDD